MPRINYNNPQYKNARCWVWDCLVEGCKTCQWSKSGSRKPVKFAVARKRLEKHMDEYHPELDRYSGTVRKVKQ